MTRSRSQKAQLTTLLNISPELARKLKRVGVFSKKDFLASDPYSVFHLLRKKVTSSLGREALASIVGAASNVPWQDVTQEAAIEYERRYPLHKWKKDKL